MAVHNFEKVNRQIIVNLIKHFHQNRSDGFLCVDFAISIMSSCRNENGLFRCAAVWSVVRRSLANPNSMPTIEHLVADQFLVEWLSLLYFRTHFCHRYSTFHTHMQSAAIFNSNQKTKNHVCRRSKTTFHSNLPNLFFLYLTFEMAQLSRPRFLPTHNFGNKFFDMHFQNESIAGWLAEVGAILSRGRGQTL